MFMVTFFVVMNEILNFNIGWLVNFLLSNLFWVFALVMLSYIFFGRAKFFEGIVFLTFALWLWDDFGSLSGIGFASSGVLLIYYISKISILAVVENSKELKKHLLVISTATGVVALVISNVFM